MLISTVYICGYIYSIGSTMSGHYFEGTLDLTLYNNPVLSVDYTSFLESFGVGRMIFKFDCGSGLQEVLSITPIESGFNCAPFNSDVSFKKYGYSVMNLPVNCRNNGNVVIRYDYSCDNGGNCMWMGFSNILIVDTSDIGNINACITSAYTYPPTNAPTVSTTLNPTKKPTQNPTVSPSKKPTLHPSRNPTENPTKKPSKMPTKYPTINPTVSPTLNPTKKPTKTPTVSPSEIPTTKAPSNAPTHEPTNSSPTVRPTSSPTDVPTANPTNAPTVSPTQCLNYRDGYNISEDASKQVYTSQEFRNITVNDVINIDITSNDTIYCDDETGCLHECSSLLDCFEKEFICNSKR